MSTLHNRNPDIVHTWTYSDSVYGQQFHWFIINRQEYCLVDLIDNFKLIGSNNREVYDIDLIRELKLQLDKGGCEFANK